MQLAFDLKLFDKLLSSRLVIHGNNGNNGRDVRAIGIIRAFIDAIRSHRALLCSVSPEDVL